MKTKLFIFITLIAAVLITSCTEDDGLFQVGSVSWADKATGGVAVCYLYDAITGQRLTATSATVTVNNGANSGTLSTSDSKVGILDSTRNAVVVYDADSGADSTIKIAYSGYYTMEYATGDIADGLFSASLYPNDTWNSTPAYDIEVRNANNGELISSGSYIIKPDVAAIDTSHLDTATVGAPFTAWTYNINPPNAVNGLGTSETMSGSFSSGTISVSANSLLYGASYVVVVYDMDGYTADFSVSTSLTAGTDTTDSTNLLIAVAPTGEPTLRVMRLGHIAANGEDYLTSENNMNLTYYFNHDIEVDYDALKDNTSPFSTFVTIPVASLADNDGDDSENLINSNAYTNLSADGNFPAGIGVSVSGNVLTITLSDDSYVVTGGANNYFTSVDTEEILYFDCSALVGGGNILVRRLNAVDDPWETLKSVGTDVEYLNAGLKAVPDRVYINQYHEQNN